MSWDILPKANLQYFLSKLKAIFDAKAEVTEVEGSKTVTGSIVTVDDAADIYAEELMVDIEPIQDLHGYDKPWVGGGNLNLINPNGYSDVGYTTITVNGDDVTINSTSTWRGGRQLVSISSNASYFLYARACGRVELRYYDSNDTQVGSTLVYNTSISQLLTTPADAVEASIVLSNGTTTSTDILFSQIMFAKSDTIIPFSPYSNISPIQGYDIVSVDRCGRNIFSGIDFANALHDASNTSTIDTTNKTVTYNRYKTETVVLFDKLKPNTTYTLIMTGNVNSANTVNNSIALRDNEGGLYGFTFNSTTKTRKKITLDNVEALILTWANGAMATVYYDECGLFEGEVTVEQFEEYLHQRISLQLGNKNLLPMTVEGIKAANTSVTWSGNSYTVNGVTFTIQTDSNGNVTGIKVNGIASAATYFSFGKFNIAKGQYYFTTDSNGAYNTYYSYLTNSASSSIIVRTDDQSTYPNGLFTLSADETNSQAILAINSGYNAQNIVFHPMIRYSYISDPTFSPYNFTLGGMVYGGQLTLKDDGSAVFVGDKAEVVYDGSSDESWSRLGGSTVWGDYTMYTSLSRVKYTDGDVAPNFKTNYLNAIPFNPSWASYDGFISKNPDNDTLYTAIKSITTVANWRTYLASNPLQVVYPLVNPFTIHLSAEQLKLLQGTNNVWSNADDITLKYQPDNVIAEPKADVQRLRDDVDLRLTDNACKNLVQETLIDYTIESSGRITGSTGFNIHIAKIKAGTTYTVTSNDGFVAGYFYNKPAGGSYSYNGARVVSSNCTFVAPIDGYIAFRSSGGYLTPQCEYGLEQTAYEEYYPSNRELYEMIKALQS